MTEKVKMYLAIGCTAAVFIIVMLLIFIEVPENNKELVNTTFSALIGGTIVLAFSYYFGDSDKVSDKKEKDEEV
jgi:uncharacterized membrane protein